MFTVDMKSACRMTLLGIAVFFGSNAGAQALCVNPQEAGSWRNADANTRSITRMKVDFHCQDVIAVPVGQPRPKLGPSFHMQLWGKCHPSDCVWQRVPAGKSGSTLIATIDQGFVKRRMYFVARGRTGTLRIVSRYNDSRGTKTTVDRMVKTSR